MTTDEPQPAEEYNDITRQVQRLAREIDRLPPGGYVIRLEKRHRSRDWKATIEIEERQLVRVVELKK